MTNEEYTELELKYLHYLYDNHENINNFVNSFYQQLSSPLTKPEALPTILRSYSAKMYLLLSQAAKHEPLELKL